MSNKQFLIFFFILLFFPIAIHAAEINSYVVDNANVFDSDVEAKLVENLKQFELENNGTQIVVFTENRIPNGSTFEERSLSLAEDNLVGTEQDNGVLFYLAVDDRQYRWEVGYGLEPVLNSAWLGRMSRDYMVPDFHQGNYSLGILKGLQQVELKIVDSEYNSPNTSSYNQSTLSSISSFFASNPILFFLLLIIIINLLKLIFRKQATSAVNDALFIGAASNMFRTGRGGGLGGFGGGFHGGGGSFGGGGFSGRF